MESSSMSVFTPIQPSGSSLGGNWERPAKRRRENTRQACLKCRQNRSKCDSVRPICGPCTGKGRDCKYEFSQEGVSRQSAMRARLDSLEQLFLQLRQSTAPKAQRLFKRLRSNKDVGALLQSLDDDVGQDSEEEDNDDEIKPTTNVPSIDRQRSLLSGLAEEKSGDLFESDGQVETAEALRDGKVDEPTTQISLCITIPTADVTRSAMDNFFACAGTLLHVFSREQANQFYQEVFKKGHVQDASWRSNLCCLCAMAAIGKAYDNTLSARGSSKLYYEVAKSLFEDLIETRSLDGIKVCTLLALFNIFDKATLALIHVEVGMSLAKYYGLDQQDRKLVDMSRERWTDYRKAWRTLLFFKSWMCFTLGYMAGDDALTERGVKPEDLEITSDGGLEDQIQSETAKISLIKAKILRINFVFGNLAEGTVQSISRELEDWLQKLPQSMRLEALRNGEDISDDHRRSLYYVHLLYQGARMLLYRRLLSQHIEQGTKPRPIDQSVLDSATMLQAFTDGRKVADMTSHTLRILQNENGIFKRCWLVIFQAFTSANLILYEAAQKQLQDMPEKLWRADLEMAQAPLSTLDFCGTLDPIASKFYHRLIPFFRSMHLQRSGSVTEMVAERVEVSGDASYLCKVPKGDSEKSERALALQDMLCRPFGEPRQKVNHLEVEHLDWHLGSSIPFRWEQNLEGVQGDKAEAVNVSNQSNAFLGNNKHPSGWASPPPSTISVEGASRALH